MSNNLSIFASTIVAGGTIYNASTARITGDKVGAENYAAWKTAMTAAHEHFYRYEYAVDLFARGKEVDIKAAKNAGMDALKAVFALIGEVNGFTIKCSEELFAEVAKYAVRETTELVGEAFKIRSVVKNLEKELEHTNGANPEWLTAKQAELAQAEAALAIAKKSTGSGKPVDKMSTYNSFVKNFERKIAKLTMEQSMKSYEVIMAEREAEKAAKKAAKKAANAAKKAAAKAANA